MVLINMQVQLCFYHRFYKTDMQNIYICLEADVHDTVKAFFKRINKLSDRK